MQSVVPIVFLLEHHSLMIFVIIFFIHIFLLFSFISHLLSERKSDCQCFQSLINLTSFGKPPIQKNLTKSLEIL